MSTEAPKLLPFARNASSVPVAPGARRVLVADHDESSRTSSASVLRANGYTTVEVGLGRQALQQLHGGTVAVAVVAELPDTSGLDLLQATAHYRPRVPTILCTHSWNAQRAVDAMKLGAWDYLIRPFEMNKLLAVVHQAMASLDDTPARRQQEVERQARRMETLGRLAGGVIHDFNNVLTVMIGYSDMLRDSLPAGSALRGYVEEILAAGQRGAALTDQLLNFGRCRPVEQRAVDLNSLVTRVANMLGRLLGEHIDLVHRLAPGLGMVCGDPAQLEQVIVNLALNARDAMPRGGRLVLETRNLEFCQPRTDYPNVPPGIYICLRVADTGLGMTGKVKERLFEPYFTTKPDGHGTGLGLHTVAGIVERAGGFITMNSEVGKGSVFDVLLPRI